MTCQECELKLAGDDRDQAVAEHLAACAACKEFAIDLQANAQALREFSAEPMPTLIREMPAKKPAWPWVAAGAMAAAILLAIALPRHHEPVLTPSVGTHLDATDAATRGSVARAIEPPARTLAATDQTPQSRTRRSSAVRSARRRHVAEPGEPRILEVKMLTDDPNVVIYWQVETRKGTE